jgi:hypothetical protein
MFRSHVSTVQASKAHATVNSAGKKVWPTLRVCSLAKSAYFCSCFWFCFDYVVAPQRRVIPTGCRDELKRSHGQVDALGRVDDLDPFFAFRKMTEFHAGRPGNRAVGHH